MRSQRLVAGVLAALALVLFGIYAASAVSVTSASTTWSPTRPSASSVPLNLSAERPSTMKVQVPCDKAAAAQGRVFSTSLPLATGQGLELSAQKGSAWVSVNGRVLAGSHISLGSGRDCTLSLEYGRAEDALVIASSGNRGSKVPVGGGGDPTSRTDVPWQVNALTAAPGAIPGISVEIVTQPTTFHSSPWRWALACSTMVACGASLVLLARSMGRDRSAEDNSVTGNPGAEGHLAVTSSSRWAPTDSIVVAVCLVALLVVPPTFDDGWVLTTVRQFDELGFFSNYFSIEATPQPLGFWWNWLQHWWLGPLWTPGFLLRVPAALLIVAGWRLLRRAILDVVPMDLVESDSKATRWAQRAACIVYLVVASSFLFTLRPEPLISLLVIATIATGVTFERNRDPRLIVVLAGLSALALSAHQTGWCVVLASIIWTPGVLRWARGQTLGSVVGVAGTLAISGGIAFLTLAMLGMNLSTWRQAIRAFAEDPTSYSMVFREDKRIEHLMEGNVTGAGKIFVLALILILVAGFLTRLNRTSALSSQTGYAAVGAMSGLVLTSSKLPDHLGVTAGPLAILAWIVVSDGSRASTARVGLMTVGLAIGARLATEPLFTPSRNTDLVADSPNLADEIPASFLPVSSPAFWILLVGVAAAIGGRISAKGSVSPVTTFAVAASLVVAVPVIGMLPGVRQGGDPSSWIGQTVRVVDGTCGLGDRPTVPTRWRAVEAARPSSDSGPLLDNPADPQASPPFGPVPGVRIYAVPFGKGGFVATPWFPVAPGAMLATWTQSGGLPMAYSVEFATGAGEALAPQAVKRSADSGVWQSVKVNPPAGTARMRISWFSDDGPRAVSSPVAVAAQRSIREISGGGPTWVSPNTYLEAPCLRPPSIASGTYEAFPWSFGPPTWNGALPGETLTEMGCPTTNMDRRLRCTYSVNDEAFASQPGDSAEPPTSSTTTVLVSGSIGGLA